MLTVSVISFTTSAIIYKDWYKIKAKKYSKDIKGKLDNLDKTLKQVSNISFSSKSLNNYLAEKRGEPCNIFTSTGDTIEIFLPKDKGGALRMIVKEW